MSKYILHYFGFNGRGAVPRAILSYAKADWTNHLIKQEEWPKIKKSGLCEFEQLPVLEVNGKKYCECQAISLYLGETFDLLGKDVEENYQINNLLLTTDDFAPLIFQLVFCKDEVKKAELKRKTEEKFKFYLSKFEKRYVELGKNKYFLGDKFTLADIYLATSIPSTTALLGLKESPCKEVAPNIGELIKRVNENELKEYHEKFFFK